MAKLSPPEVEPSLPVAKELPLYRIDREQFEASGRSFWATASARFCKSCQRKYGASGAEDGRSRAKRPAKGAKAPDPFAVVKDCCSKTAGYLDNGLPITEAMFRILLAHGHRPLDLAEMQGRLESWAATAERRRDLSLPTIRRILDHATFYNINRVPPEAAESTKRA
ncbi:MAG: hypothetical protein EXR60_01475 [Dehalococcoidia bacterium]|nr:hypothetical protein [Dehalococcoidia bacterium]